MKKMHRAIVLAILVLPVLAASPTVVLAEGATGLTYPETERIEHYDDYHGTKVHDPYRWLEDDVRESEEVANWVEEQNKVTFGYLGRIAERERIKERLTKLWDYEKLYTPWQEGGRYFVYKNDGLQNQNVLYIKDSLDGDERRVGRLTPGGDPHRCRVDLGRAIGPGTAFSLCAKGST